MAPRVHIIAPMDATTNRVACNCCPRTYAWAEYLALPAAANGGSKIEVDDGVWAEVRNCECGATMARTEGE